MDYVGETPAAQRLGDELDACAVDRGVDDFEVGVTFDDLGVERKCLDGCKEVVVHLVTDNLDARGVAVKLDFFYALDAVDVVDDVDIMRSDNLSAVAPVCLVAVVDFGVVRGCDVDAALAA